MSACLKNSLEKGIPLLDGEYLRRISRKDLMKIFQGNIEIPLFEKRLEILREVGEVLVNKYRGHFYNLVKLSNHKLFDNDKGIVERLINDFSSFDDSVIYKGLKIRFDKRAQLGPATLYGRFRNCDVFRVDDINELTVFADYVLPKGLRDLGILKYEKSLANRVDSQKIIPANSREELEIRASTIHASKMIVERVNEIKCSSEINSLHIDYKLWSESRRKKGSHHLTITIAY